jgi:hypothetical protein
MCYLNASATGKRSCGGLGIVKDSYHFWNTLMGLLRFDFGLGSVMIAQ